MAWNNFYWDTLHNYFWNPEWIGLDPVKDAIETEDGYIKVAGYHDANGKIRYRAKKYPAVRDKMAGDEGALNEFFNIMFAIAPDYIIRKWFCQPLGFDASGKFRSFGRIEIAERFRWGEANVTQHDGFFVSNDAVVCVEIKLTPQLRKIRS